MDEAVKENGLATIGASKVLAPTTFVVGAALQVSDVESMLFYCIENGAEDLLLTVGNPWAIQWSGKVMLLGDREIYAEEMESLLCAMTNNRNAALSIYGGTDYDFHYSMRTAGRGGKVLRFRCNATGILGANGGRGIAIVIRPAGDIPRTMDELGVPMAIQLACMPKSGIVIVSGPTGSGKTTLLDSFLRAQATHPDGKHILSFYAPIETDLNAIPGRTGIISQSDIGPGTYGGNLPTFEAAVRNCLRRHPNVVIFGEARDKPTIAGAVLVALSGHTTYTTTHTASVHMTIPRMGDSFSGAERVRVVKGLIENTRLIVHQRLLKRPGGIGRAPVRSWLVFTQEIRSRLSRVPLDDLPTVIEELTRTHGRGLLEDAEEQYQAGNISEEELLGLRQELEYGDTDGAE